MIYVGGTIDNCYEFGDKEERIIGKYDQWSVLEVGGRVFIGGYKEVCIFEKREGKMTKNIKTKDNVYVMCQIDEEHIVCGERNGHLEVINIKRWEVVSEGKVAGTVFDMCRSSKEKEYILVGNTGLSIVKIDTTY